MALWRPTSLGVNRTGSIDGPLMAALSNTHLGDWLRPEVGYYRSLGVRAFNLGPSNTQTGSNGPQNDTVFAGGGAILHF